MGELDNKIKRFGNQLTVAITPSGYLQTKALLRSNAIRQELALVSENTGIAQDELLELIRQLPMDALESLKYIESNYRQRDME